MQHSQTKNLFYPIAITRIEDKYEDTKEYSIDQKEDESKTVNDKNVFYNLWLIVQ